MKMQKKCIVLVYFIVWMTIFLFYFVIRFVEFSSVKEIDTSGYMLNDNVSYEIEGLVDSKNMFISGYSYWYGDVERGLHFTVALRDMTTGEIYEIPTIVQERDDQKEKYSPISHFGFVARMNKKKLDLDHRKYQVCFIDKISDGGVIAHSNDYIGEG